MKKRKLRKLLLLEAGQRQEAETLLGEARVKLAEMVLVQAGLEKRIDELEGQLEQADLL